ncbi:MAG: BhlA/UviB family holin-like peptide [Caulobacteraceae bacterium]
MESEIIKLASTQGLWAVLSVVLIFYVLKAQEKRDSKQEEREKKYQEIITNLTERLNIVNEVKNDVVEIKEYIFNKKL